MKKMRRFPAAVLAFAMLMTAALAGCQSKSKVAPPNEVAVALFDLVMRDDAAAAKEALGYESEEAVRADFGMDGDLYDAVVGELVDQLEDLLGGTATEEDMRTLLDAFLGMVGKLKLTAEVKEMDERAGTAVVTCTVNVLDMSGVGDAVQGTLMEALTGDSSDPDATVSTVVLAMADIFNSLEPGDQTNSFDVDFSLDAVEINGKAQKVWIPADANAFGQAISAAALGA